MIFRISLRWAVFCLGMAALSGCSALSGIQSASKPLDTFELTPLPAGTISTPRSRRHLEVALPTATGALASERILIKPTPLRIESLPDARWVNEATEHLQLLLVRSMANSGRFALVTSEGEGPLPDYVLLTDLQAFQVEIMGDKTTVEIHSTMTLLRDTNDSVIASRSFANSEVVSGTSTEQVMPAFDVAMTRHLTDVVEWLVRVSGG